MTESYPRCLNWAALAACLAFPQLAWGQSDPVHGHLNVGAASTSQGSALSFVNGEYFLPSTGWSKPMVMATNGAYSGYYQGSITFTALPATAKNSESGVADPQAAAFGSFLRASVLSVTGPQGGSFAFWDANATSPTFTWDSGYSSLTPLSSWALSDAALGAGAAGADPFGHIHGRRFTVTVPGDYFVTFQAFDASVNGLNGGPIHSASAPLTIEFSAVAAPEPGTLALGAAGIAGMVLFNRRKRIL